VLICLLVFGFNSLSAQQAATTPVTLTVTDPTGARIPHLQIRVVPTPDPAPKRETDEKGKLSLDLTPSGYALFARLSGFKPLPRRLSPFNNPHTSADETYSGVRVADILTPRGAPLGKELHGIALTTYLVATGSDGYQAVFALAEVDPSFHPGEILVADTMNGKRLDEHSGPLKLVVTEDKRPARSVRSVRNLTTIELKAAQ
jgi:hypothetical protein